MAISVESGKIFLHPVYILHPGLRVSLEIGYRRSESKTRMMGLPDG